MITRAVRSLWWYLRQASGEARWDEYVERCHRDGTSPMSRRDFERHRAEHREADARSRCC